MKTLSYLNLSVMAVALAAGSAEGHFLLATGSGEGESRTILVVNPNGSCALTNVAVQARKALELHVASWERYSGESEGIGPEDQEPAIASPQPAKPAQKSLTNEELASKLREMYQQQPDLGE